MGGKIVTTVVSIIRSFVSGPIEWDDQFLQVPKGNGKSI